MIKQLKDIADLNYGPYEKTISAGDAKYLLASHFDGFGQLTDFSDSFIQLNAKSEKFLLKPKDLIYASKGTRMFAWAYDSTFGNCIPSSLFYIIRLNTNLVLAEYLAYYLNTEKVEFLIKNMATGGIMQSIPKKELLELEIGIPTIEEQRRIIELGKIIDRDIILTEKLLIEKMNLKKGLINKLITNQINK